MFAPEQTALVARLVLALFLMIVSTTKAQSVTYNELAYVMPAKALSSSYPSLRPLFADVRAALAYMQGNRSRFSPHIVLLPGTHSGTNSTDFDLPDSFTLRGARASEASGSAIINCANSGRRGFVMSDVDATISDVTLRFCGNKKVQGGAVLVMAANRHVVTFTNVVFLNNQAIQGGAIFLMGDALLANFYNCRFQSNSALRRAGSIFQYGGESMFKDSVIINGTTITDSGGVYLHSGVMTYVNTSVYNCSATQAGGVQINYGTFNVLGGVFKGNNATKGNGGAMLINAAVINFTNVLFQSNFATDRSGAVKISKAPTGLIILVNCTFDGNGAGTNAGGGMHIKETIVSIINCTFIRNQAFDFGGGIFAELSVTTVSGCTFIQNTAGSAGGGASLAWTSTVDRSTFIGNVAPSGGGFDIQAGASNITNCIFQGNKAGMGGGVSSLVPNVVLNIASSQFNANVATTSGGAAYFVSAGTVSNSVLTANKATLSGGGFFVALGSKYTLASTIGNSGNLAAYGSDRASSAASLIAIRLASDNNTAWNRLGAQPEQLIHIFLRIVDSFGQQVSVYPDLPLAAQAQLMLKSNRLGLITSFVYSSFSAGKGIASINLTVVGAFSDTLPVKFSVVGSSPALETTLLVDISPCGKGEVPGLPLGNTVKYDFKICVPEVLLTLDSVSPSITWTITALATVCVILCMVLIGIVFRLREAPVFKAASPLFLEIFLGWSAVLASSAIAYASPPSPASCVLRGWLLCLGSFGVLTTLFLKTFRIYVIFNNKTLSRVHFGNKKLLGLVILAQLVMVLVLVVWTAVFMPTPTSLQTGKTTYTVTCGEHDPRMWPFILTALALLAVVNVFGVYLAFQIRNVHARFNESKFIVASVYLIFLLLLVFVPLVALMGGSADMLALLVSLGAVLAAFVLVGLMILQKLWVFVRNNAVGDSSSIPPSAPILSVVSSASSSGRDTNMRNVGDTY